MSDTLLVFVTILVVYNLLFQITNDIPIVSNFVFNIASMPNTNCDWVACVVVCYVAHMANIVADSTPFHGWSGFVMRMS